MCRTSFDPIPGLISCAGVTGNGRIIYMYHTYIILESGMYVDVCMYSVSIQCNIHSQLPKMSSSITKDIPPKRWNPAQGGPCVTLSNGERLETVMVVKCRRIISEKNIGGRVPVCLCVHCF